jgi:hypothetical protein
MKRADSGDGARRSGKKNGAASNRPVERQAGSDPEQPTAPFVTTDATPVDAPMWRLHPVVWFQPELAPSGPEWSGLAVERCGRIPAPDFLNFDVAPLGRADSRDNSSDAATPAARPQAPQDDGAPLGWDPRSVRRKEEHE